MTSISFESMEMVGRLCPFLKSFSLNYPGARYSDGYEDNKVALTIAKSMPEQRPLQLFGNFLTNNGLQAILDGCTHLESLDLRQCYNVELGGDLGKRCSQQIKNLGLPYVSAAETDVNYFCAFSDLDIIDDYDEDYLDYDDFPHWDHEDSDCEDIFGFY